MNIKNSGKFPDIIKKIVAGIAVLSITSYTGCSCVPSETISEESSQISSSEDGSTHVPIEDSSSGTENGTSSESSDFSGSAAFESGDSTNSSVAESSEDNLSSEAESSEQSSEETPIVSETSVPESSSEVPTASVSEPDPPPVSNPEPVSVPNSNPTPVVVPNFPMPSSPGTLCAVSENGVIDYSNASQGYISARYTGSKSKAKLVIKCGDKSAYNHDLSLDHTTEYFSLPFGSGEYTVTIGEIKPNGRYAIIVEQSFTVNIEYSLSPFMYPNKYSNYNSNSNCVYKAAEVCAGKAGTIDKIAAIFEWVTSNITYDDSLAATVQTGYVPDPDRTFNSRTGICFDYASLMCAMLRSQSIPTRLVIGYASPDIYHAWNEVYTEETGWITPELMLRNAGYNITDSTFYASAGDKSQIASYISNESNYQALYYY